MIIGKLVEIDEKDAYYCDRESLVGTIWDITEMYPHSTRSGLLQGTAKLIQPTTLEYVSNFFERPVMISFAVGKRETNTFHAVKFEILENTGE